MLKLRDKIIKIMLNSDYEFISGEEISKLLGISRAAVWKHIKNLKEQGYEIESINKKGYRLKEKPMDILTQQNIIHLLNTGFIGRNIIHFDTIDSTNTYAKSIGYDSCDGTVVISEEQTSGRGRIGRLWHSKKHEGIWMSIILKPDITPMEAPFITLIAGASVVKALSNLGIESYIKWPNDLIINGKKVCGILTELSAEIERVNYIVVGIGINVKSIEFDNEISKVATSIFKEGYEVTRVDIVKNILEEFEHLYKDYIHGGNKEAVLEICRNKSAVVGKKVYAIKGNQKEFVECLDINEDGNLIVKNE
ncbi:MAG: biotin--[acetyl-CoA-carboxylase] ligase, partial [Paraclostridium sp.]